jgi:hypothetical protein
MRDKIPCIGLQGNSFAAFGMENIGKTTFICDNFIKKPSGVVWDPKAQYNGLCTTYEPGRVPTKEKLEEFIEFVITLDKVVAVVEEASTFFSNTGKASDMMLGYQQSRYHTRSIPINIFQNISEMPHSIYKRTDWFILFPTGETLAQVKEKYDNTRLCEAFMSGQAKKFDPLILRKVKAA